MKNHLISLEGVSYSYSESSEKVLDNVDFTLYKNDYAAILGTSGSGKSTLLSLLGLINQPTAGTCSILGNDVRSLTDESISNLKTYEFGYIYQNFNLLNAFTVFDNVAMPLNYNKHVHRKDYAEKVDYALKTVGMEQFCNRYPTQLSGGQQQRVAIARALVNSPSILFADEPTGNLDSKNSNIIYDLFNELHAQNKTICLITHDKNHAKRANSIWQIVDGKVSFESRQ